MQVVVYSYVLFSNTLFCVLMCGISWQVCESDFTKNLATEETEEADAVAVYEKTTQENKLSVTMKSQDAKYE